MEKSHTKKKIINKEEEEEENKKNIKKEVKKTPTHKEENKKNIKKEVKKTPTNQEEKIKTPIQKEKKETLIKKEEILKPRYLTGEEIEYIVNVIPISEVISASLDTTKSVHKQILDHLREQLKEIELVPNIEALDKMRETILKKYKRSRIAPGQTVGAVAADSLGQPITQMSLDAKHIKTVLKNMTSGVDRINQLLNLTETTNNSSMIIYFNHPVSYTEVLIDKKREIIDIRVKDIVDDANIDEYENIIQEEPWWYDLYNQIMDVNIEKPKYILRLKLNVNLMYLHGITMDKVASVIQLDTPPDIKIIYSPMSEGIMDIYPVEHVIMSNFSGEESSLITSDNASMLFLSIIVLPNLDKIQIKGIQNIRELEPIKESILPIISKQEKVGENLWHLIYDKIKMKMTGIKPYYIERLIKTANLKVKSESEDYLTVVSDENPVVIINRLISEFKDKETAYLKQARENGEMFPYMEPSEIITASTFVYAQTQGSNLESILELDDIDTEHTISNNPEEIMRTFGIEAARNFLIREFISLFQSAGQKVSPRHIILLVDFMSNQEMLTKITHYGIKRQPTGALTKASFQRSMEVFTEAALFGKPQEVRTTSSSIAIGKMVELGTNYMDIIYDKKKEEQFLNELKLKKKNKISLKSLKSALSTKSTIESSPISIENSLSEMFNSNIKPISSENSLSEMFNSNTTPISSENSLSEMFNSNTTPISPEMSIIDKPITPPPITLDPTPSMSKLLIYADKNSPQSLPNTSYDIEINVNP